MSRRRAALLLPVLLAVASPALAQVDSAARPAAAAAPSASPRLTIRDVGPGRAGRILRDALARPHVAIHVPGDSGALTFARDTTFTTTVIVIGRDLTVASQVRGDVIVIGGDLWLHPGARVDGRAIAIGGGAYNSSLATVGSMLSFRDVTFDATPVGDGSVALEYREISGPPGPTLFFPLFYGVRLPSYDRVNGLTLSWGPTVSLDTGRLEIDAVVSYRSHLGNIDPAVRALFGVGRRTAVGASLERGTFTNDGWIRPEIVNSLTTLASGQDTRNHYRGDRAEARFTRRYEGERSELTPFAGARVERAWSVGPAPGATSRPWSATGRADTLEGMLRPNPAIDRGTIASALGGAALRWEDSTGMAGGMTALLEAPVAAPGDRRFAQLTLDGTIGFPTFGTQRFAFEAHVVLTPGDTAPRQRFAYLGGSGTLPTMTLLSQGGDQLLFTESRYNIPLDRIVLPFVGSPSVMFRHMAGSAGIQRLPRFTQNLGVRGVVSFARVDFVWDPRTGDTNVGVGVSVAR